MKKKRSIKLKNFFFSMSQNIVKSHREESQIPFLVWLFEPWLLCIWRQYLWSLCWSESLPFVTYAAPFASKLQYIRIYFQPYSLALINTRKSCFKCCKIKTNYLYWYKLSCIWSKLSYCYLSFTTNHRVTIYLALLLDQTKLVNWNNQKKKKKNFTT